MGWDGRRELWARGWRWTWCNANWDTSSALRIGTVHFRFSSFQWWRRAIGDRPRGERGTLSGSGTVCRVVALRACFSSMLQPDGGGAIQIGAPLVLCAVGQWVFRFQALDDRDVRLASDPMVSAAHAARMAGGSWAAPCGQSEHGPGAVWCRGAHVCVRASVRTSCSGDVCAEGTAG